MAFGQGGRNELVTNLPTIVGNAWTATVEHDRKKRGGQTTKMSDPDRYSSIAISSFCTELGVAIQAAVAPNASPSLSLASIHRLAVAPYGVSLYLSDFMNQVWGAPKPGTPQIAGTTEMFGDKTKQNLYKLDGYATKDYVKAFFTIIQNAKSATSMVLSPTPSSMSPAHAPAQGTTQGSTQGTAQGSAQGPTQGTAQGSMQGTAQGPTQGSTQGSMQGSTQGTTQRSTQGGLMAMLPQALPPAALVNATMNSYSEKFQSYSNDSPAIQQGLEFKLAQRATNAPGWRMF